MRHLLSIAAIVMVFISSQTFTYAISKNEAPPINVEIDDVQPEHPHEDMQVEQDEKVSVIVEVEGDPAKHKEFLDLHHPYVEVIATYDKLFNGLALQAAPEKLAKMQSLEFIKAVHPVRTYEAITEPNSQENELTNADIPSSLNTTTFTGKGIKVGVVDTGIDYNHPDLMANYAGGYDLVDLDDDPMETEPSEGIPTLHGTHVAGIIGANGELQGVAPDAEIYAYRALGRGGMGTSIQVIAAMEQAVKDGVDVMNLSLGNAGNGPYYPTSIAVNRADELGVAVVIANGNNGPDNWTVGSPATATKAISVGAIQSPQQIPYLQAPLKDEKIPLLVMHGSIPW